MQIDRLIKILIILILIVCLFKFPYWVYTLNRTLVAIGFVILCYRANRAFGENSNITLSYLGVAFVFQPI
ncbi:DUF6804 family protein [Pedobacter sp.]|uniref:DUF6804 family protein n=1 Tax=Pedobacter sp. TaxID=1411316 RepID=UPI003BAC492A